MIYVNIKQLVHMYEMQKELNELCMAPPRTEPSMTDVHTAMICEIGEVLQECKSMWCWWKLARKPVDRDKLLEELIDVLHFALCYEIMYYDDMVYDFSEQEFDILQQIEKLEGKGADVHFYYFKKIIECNERKVPWILALAEEMEFSFEELYEAYCIKHSVNVERMKNGY